MTKDEALKMAYDWLNEYAPPEVIQACKEALEQPTMTYEDGFAHGYEAHRAEQALEQPAQEPVAYCDINNWEFETPANYYHGEANGYIPLYSHPAPAWQGLSDDEIDKIIAYPWGETKDWVRAIEQALKEKNHV